MINFNDLCILIVDDSPENIRVVADILGPNFDLKIARDGATAIEILKTPPYPDLVLLDIMMPGMDGYEVCNKIKGNPNIAGIPVIFITAKSLEEDVIKGFEMGGVDYITKPFNEKELVARIKTHLELKTINEQLEKLVKEETKKRLNQETTFTQLFNSLSSFIAIISEDFKFSAVNKKYTEFFDIEEDKLIGLHLSSVMGKVYFEAVEAKLAKVLIGKTETYEGKIPLSEDVTIDSETIFSPFYNDNNEITGIIINTLDTTEKMNLITELKQQEEKLIQQKKLADMGQMINAIAHQWRQPLNALGLLGQEMIGVIQTNDLEKDLMDDYDRIHMQLIDHLSKTIDDFRHFFKTDKELTEFEVVFEIIHLINLIVTQFKTSYVDIKFSCKCGKSSFKCINFIESPPCEHHNTKVKGYLGEFKQAIMNLIYNAYDSVQTQAEITGKPGCINISLDAGPESVRISIADNGTGIPDDILPRVFEPYFTTKDEGKGTGIGLYMTKTVIEGHMKGKISIENRRKGGAVATISIPASE